MNIGDRLAVQIEGMDVAEAVIEDITDGNAIIVIPSTRLVVKLKSSLDMAATKAPEVDRVFAGLSEEQGTTKIVEEPAAPTAPVVGESLQNIKTFPGEME